MTINGDIANFAALADLGHPQSALPGLEKESTTNAKMRQRHPSCVRIRRVSQRCKYSLSACRDPEDVGHGAHTSTKHSTREETGRAAISAAGRRGTRRALHDEVTAVPLQLETSAPESFARTTVLLLRPKGKTGPFWKG